MGAGQGTRPARTASPSSRGLCATCRSGWRRRAEAGLAGGALPSAVRRRRRRPRSRRPRSGWRWRLLRDGADVGRRAHRDVLGRRLRLALRLRFTASADAASVSLTASFSEPSRRASLIPEIVPVVAFAASVVAAPSFATISSEPFRFLSVATLAATSRVVASIRRCASAPYSSRRPPTSLAGAAFRLPSAAAPRTPRAVSARPDRSGPLTLLTFSDACASFSCRPPRPAFVFASRSWKSVLPMFALMLSLSGGRAGDVTVGPRPPPSTPGPPPPPPLWRGAHGGGAAAAGSFGASEAQRQPGDAVKGEESAMLQNCRKFVGVSPRKARPQLALHTASVHAARATARGRRAAGEEGRRRIANSDRTIRARNLL